jgi:hypothetical protein
MPRQDAEQLLSRIAGGAGDGHTNGAGGASARFRGPGLNCRMHRKAYLYILLVEKSTKIDE